MKADFGPLSWAKDVVIALRERNARIGLPIAIAHRKSPGPLRRGALH